MKAGTILLCVKQKPGVLEVGHLYVSLRDTHSDWVELFVEERIYSYPTIFFKIIVEP